jgi:hypothetical protein
MAPLRLIGGRPTTVEERRLALRIAAVFAIPISLIMVIPLIAGMWVYRHETQARLKDDRILIARVDRERIERSRAINRFVYEQCIQAEIRDVVIVQQLQAAIARARASLPAGSAILQHQVQTLKDGILVLEPPDEPDCTPPPAVKPKGQP